MIFISDRDHSFPFVHTNGQRIWKKKWTIQGSAVIQNIEVRKIYQDPRRLITCNETQMLVFEILSKAGIWLAEANQNIETSEQILKI